MGVVIALAFAAGEPLALGQSTGSAITASGAAAESSVANDTAAIRSSLDAGNRDARLLSEGDQPWRREPVLEMRYLAARQQLREVETRLKSAGDAPAPALLSALAGEAEMAAREMTVLLEISRTGQSPDATRGTARNGAEYARYKTDLQRKIDYAKATIDKTRVRRAIVRKEARPAIENLQVVRSRAVAALRGDLNEILAARAELAAAIARSDRALSDSQRPPTTPEALVRAAEALFAGEYRRVIDTLDPLTFGTYGRYEGQRHLFVAAAAYSLFQMGGGSDDGLRVQARQNVRLALEADPDVQPSEKVFSPRFVAFFRANAD